MFGANTLQDSFYIIGSVFTHYEGNVFALGLDWKEMIVAIVAMLTLLTVDIIQERKGDIRELIAARALPIRWTIYIVLLLAVLVFGAYGGGIYSVSPFIYGNF